MQGCSKSPSELQSLLEAHWFRLSHIFHQRVGFAPMPRWVKTSQQSFICMLRAMLVWRERLSADFQCELVCLVSCSPSASTAILDSSTDFVTSICVRSQAIILAKDSEHHGAHAHHAEEREDNRRSMAQRGWSLELGSLCIQAARSIVRGHVEMEPPSPRPSWGTNIWMAILGRTWIQHVKDDLSCQDMNPTCHEWHECIDKMKTLEPLRSFITPSVFLAEAKIITKNIKKSLARIDSLKDSQRRCQPDFKRDRPQVFGIQCQAKEGESKRRFSECVET